jgi:hypothetical protein
MLKGATIMLDHILRTALTFEKVHGIPPDIIYINPYHYENLCRHHPELCDPDQDICLGFRLVIVPSCTLYHPEAALLTAAQRFFQVA